LLSRGMRVYVGGSSNEPTGLLDAIAAQPASAAGVTFVQFPLAGLNNHDPSSWHPEARVECFFMAPQLANGFAQATDDAYSDLNRGIELNPRSPVAFAFRAIIYKQSGQPDIGAKDVETATKLDPDSPEALWAKGEIEEASGQADTAIEDLRRVLQLKPGWQFAADALKRLGAPVDDGEDKPQASLDFEKWRVMQHGKDFVAISDEYPQLRVPLELMGDGLPKLLSWEIKAAPYASYGILRFSGGRIAGKSGPEETELAAVIDIPGAKVIAIEPNRQGTKVSNWTWDGDRLQVASVDGVTDEYQLRPVAVAVVGAGVGRRPDEVQSAQPWAPWDQPLGMSPTQRQDSRPRHSGKPKTLFDLFFGN